MGQPANGLGTAVFSTCAQSADHDPIEFVERVIEASRWSEEAGCAGMLVYTDNRLVEPWLVAQVVLQNTERLCPLIAVQPIYMHPYTVANMITSYAFLYGRRVYLNLVAGGFRNDLLALGDTTPHDRRYDRLVEYTTIVQELLKRSADGKPLKFEGEFFQAENLRLTPPIPEELLPGIFLSGSSEAGMRAVHALGATGIQYPRPAAEYDEPLPDDGPEYGMRVGIITRAAAEDAWEVAERRFPEDRKGQLTHQLAMKVSDSEWHQQLSDLAEAPAENHPYWLRPFQNYKTMCPYLVGTYDRVAEEIARYRRIGYETFILDIPPNREELEHTREAFVRAERLVSSAGSDGEHETLKAGLIHGFVESVRRFPERPALVVGDATRTYEELGRRAANVAARLDRGHLVAVLAYRSEIAYVGVLGALLAGKGYVPLNPKFPVERLRRMLELSGCDTIVAGAEARAPLEALLDSSERVIDVIVPEPGEAERLRTRFPDHRFSGLEDGGDLRAGPQAPDTDPDAVAYLLFTSGTTGDPKGVAVSHRNVTAYVRHVADRYDVAETDRFSQHFDMTFDLSVHDMFVCWERGACLHSVPEKALMAPVKFIRDSELTFWFSVPSAIALMQRLGLLRPDALPSLRCSLFCGEPLPSASAQVWQRAAPGSVVENLYGPTEATIAITAERWDPERTPAECVNGIVPIGRPFDGQRAEVVDSAGRAVPDGETGELVLAGTQVTGSYWNNPDETRRRFVALPDLGDGPWYRTSDLARRGDDGCLHYLGRQDDQVKIRGYRVELQEVDHAIRAAAGTQEAVAIAWPVKDGSADGVVAVVCAANGNGAKAEARDVMTRCAEVLPDYMIPRKVCFVDSLPLNVNGKVDRKRLARRLDEGEL